MTTRLQVAKPGRPRGSTSQTTGAMGSIKANELMPLTEFMRRMGMGRKAWFALRRAGFPCRRFGRQAFIVGADALRFFSALPADNGEGATNG